ncbi:hypothetical protein GCM10022382_31450 [Microbacterium invictum]
MLPVDELVGALAAPRVMPVLEKRLSQVRRHRAGTTVADTVIIALAAAVTATGQMITAETSVITAHRPALTAVIAAAVVALAWAASLVWLRAGAYRRGVGERLALLPILHSAVIGLAALAIVEGVSGSVVLPAHVAVTLPVGVAALVAAHAVRRTWMTQHRTTHSMATRTLVVGDRTSVEHVIRSLTADSRFSHNVVGTVVQGADSGTVDVDGAAYTVVAAPDGVAELARSLCIETVIVAGGSDDPDYVRRLSWSLEGAATNLILATRLADVARSRIAFERTNGLALTHVSIPRFDQPTMRTKRMLDVVVALVALVPIAVITPIIALLIRMDTPGGVFFKQQRIGRDGREFSILKFRTMTATAEKDRAALEEQNEGAGPLFKMKDDPRVTRVGAVLRKYSLDELPQFWNVLRGDMSVVGPRPPLPSEVRDYNGQVFRRLYVQPGITGLWQISGRSDLSWEQSVRLDLHYVENWSLATDLRIILRTAAVMVRPNGAY